jgi:hypothetical protein
MKTFRPKSKSYTFNASCISCYLCLSDVSIKGILREIANQNLQNAPISFALSVLPYVCEEKSRMFKRIFMKFYIGGVLLTFSQTLKISLKSDKSIRQFTRKLSNIFASKSD